MDNKHWIVWSLMNYNHQGLRRVELVSDAAKVTSCVYGLDDNNKPTDTRPFKILGRPIRLADVLLADMERIDAECTEADCRKREYPVRGASDGLCK